jgi:hypothetical protein|tara:strand:- start:713 stop:1465 length:753 start_codon:yes stop_codon:yes gene_type:complete
MGFSGGGSNVLLPHTHDGRVAQDGGPLNFANITQSQSASGEIFYSDGVALQQLPIGAPNDQIRVSGANIPEYFTPTASASTVTLIDSTELLAAAADINPVFPAIDFADVSAVDVYWSANQVPANDFRIRLNGLSGGVYNYQYNRIMGGASTVGQIAAGTEVFFMPNTQYGTGHFRIIAPDPSTTANRYMMFEGYMIGIGGTAGAGNDTFFSFGGYITTNPITSCDAIRLYCPGSNLQIGSVMSIYSTSRT